MREPVVLDRLEDPAEPSKKKSAVIFLHGLGDDGRGTGYGLAQQFQIHEKLPYTKWILPTAPVDPAAGQRAWYKPHDLPSPMKPRAPRPEDSDSEGVDEEEDEEGILKTVEYIDSLVAQEVEAGTSPSNVVVGGFSQGCAVSMVWSLKGQWRSRVAGVFGLSGYFPKIKAVSVGGEGEKHATRCFFAHGMADPLVSIRVFAEGQKRLHQYVGRETIEGHVYEGLGHDVGGELLRDFWLWLKAVLREDNEA